MNARYVVTNRLGLFVAGRCFGQGQEVSLQNEEAAARVDLWRIGAYVAEQAAGRSSG